MSQYPDILGFTIAFVCFLIQIFMQTKYGERYSNLEKFNLIQYTTLHLISLIIFFTYGENSLKKVGMPSGKYGVGFKKFFLNSDENSMCLLAFYPCERDVYEKALSDIWDVMKRPQFSTFQRAHDIAPETPFSDDLKPFWSKKTLRKVYIECLKDERPITSEIQPLIFMHGWNSFNGAYSSICT